jgi:predicted nucleic acid-binding Zn ribbon protein
MRIKDALAPLGRQLGLRSPAEAARVFSRWQEIVGPEVATHASPSSLKGGVLRIAADSSVWTTEISYLAEEIKERANQVAGTDVVSEVRVWTGSGSRRATVAAPSSALSKSTSKESGPPDRKPSPDSPEEALARARNAWSEARFRSTKKASENPERRR